MKTILIHLSDFHYIPGKDEGYNLVLEELFKDIALQLNRFEDHEKILVFSGDIVQAGENPTAYSELHNILTRKLAKISLHKDKIAIAPGNHDLSRSDMQKQLVLHEGAVGVLKTEDAFNNFDKEVFTQKFDNFFRFATQVADHGIGPKRLGAGSKLNSDIDIFCLNSALCSGGGGLGIENQVIKDEGRLGVATREMHAWLRQSRAPCRILVMHHPTNWLSNWAEREIDAQLGKHFSLLLTGHTHRQAAQSATRSLGTHVHLVAPPLYTHKSGVLGYSLTEVIDGDVIRVRYRQWTSGQVFVAGTSFSHTDDGEIEIHRSHARQTAYATTEIDGATTTYLKNRLNDALKSYSSQPVVLAHPVLSTHSELNKEADSKSPAPTFGVEDLLKSGENFLITAPPLFGLTCTAHLMAVKAWEGRKQFWIYLDSKNVKPNRKSIGDAITAELSLASTTMANAECIIVDSMRSGDKDAAKLANKIREFYPSMRVICMCTDDGLGSTSPKILGLAGEFSHRFLWSMNRTAVKKVVCDYMDLAPIADEELVTSKILSDLEVMNIHRTPLNCLTLLKISEIEFDSSPVNRTEMIKRVLFLLFNVDNIPNYKSRPDLKDCEWVLGYLSEQLIRTNEKSFSRDKALALMRECARERLLDLDVDTVFDILYQNRILVSSGYLFEFRFTYWIYYFGAQRMRHNPHFAEFMLANMRYANYPEIIEFYTGGDRQRDDAIATLCEDLKRTTSNFKIKMAFPEDIDPFGVAQWRPSPKALESMHEEMVKGVEKSNLPDSVKDQYADQNYDKSRPYRQEIRQLFEERSYYEMLQAMRASARALRNSDYVDPTLKRALLSEVLNTWEQAALVILYLIPVLAENNSAVFEGIRYVLDESFSEISIEEKFSAVLLEIPQNVSAYYQDDLYAQKMSPLLFERILGSNGLHPHLLAIIIIRQRPKGWAQIIERYISEIPKNSFYLFDTWKTLRGQYRYSFAPPREIETIERLILKATAKHVTGSKDPGIKMIEQMRERKLEGGASVIPAREADDHDAETEKPGTE